MTTFQDGASPCRRASGDTPARRLDWPKVSSTRYSRALSPEDHGVLSMSTIRSAGLLPFSAHTLTYVSSIAQLTNEEAAGGDGAGAGGFLHGEPARGERSRAFEPRPGTDPATAAVGRGDIRPAQQSGAPAPGMADGARDVRCGHPGRPGRAEHRHHQPAPRQA